MVALKEGGFSFLIPAAADGARVEQLANGAWYAELEFPEGVRGPAHVYPLGKMPATATENIEEQA